jgi:secernin
MCDTLLAPPSTTRDRAMLFGKNSDRQRNEAQAIEYVPGAKHGGGSQVACTYIQIPQVPQTHAVLLSRPCWIWGAEMGANEKGVVIGNEGLQARIPASQEKALIGMDLIRLGLERASTAAEAVQMITALLEQHGQGGNCGHRTPNYYNNGFMIADAREAFVLETVGREWLVERVADVRAMSNRYSIGRDAHSMSRGFLDMIEKGGWRSSDTQSYAEVLADPQRQHIGTAAKREDCGASLLKAARGRIDALDFMRMLRAHGSADGEPADWYPKCVVEKTVCMHAGEEESSAQTVAAMVSELTERDSLHWVTATSATCSSIFKPVLIDVPMPSFGATPTDRFDPAALWWRHEKLHRSAVLHDFPAFVERIQPERDELEARFRKRVRAVMNGGSVADRARVVAQCWNEAWEAEVRWQSLIDLSATAADAASAAGWKRMNEFAEMEV